MTLRPHIVPADANNKRKETKWAVFSLCKMSVLVEMTEGRTASLSGRAACRLFVELLPEEGLRAAARPELGFPRFFIRVGTRVGREACCLPHGSLRKSDCKPAPLSLPSQCR